jgi:hypothetical protein
VAGFSPSNSLSPCQYHSTKAPYSFSSTCFSYQKDKRTKPGNLPKNKCSLGNRGALDKKKYLHFPPPPLKGLTAISHSALGSTIQYDVTYLYCYYKNAVKMRVTSQLTTKHLSFVLPSRCWTDRFNTARIASASDSNNAVRAVMVSFNNFHLTPCLVLLHGESRSRRQVIRNINPRGLAVLIDLRCPSLTETYGRKRSFGNFIPAVNQPAFVTWLMTSHVMAVRGLLGTPCCSMDSLSQWYLTWGTRTPGRTLRHLRG